MGVAQAARLGGRAAGRGRVLSLLEREGGGRLGEIAAACGYFDQPHLNRDFRAFAGASPGDWLGRRLPDGAGTAG